MSLTSSFALPGGEVMPEETQEDALTRVLLEKLLITNPIQSEKVHETFYEAKNGRPSHLWVAFHVIPGGRFEPRPGPNVRQMKEVMPASFSRASSDSGRRIYECYQHTGL